MGMQRLLDELSLTALKLRTFCQINVSRDIKFPSRFPFVMSSGSSRRGTRRAVCFIEDEDHKVGVTNVAKISDGL